MFLTMQFHIMKEFCLTPKVEESREKTIKISA